MFAILLCDRDDVSEWQICKNPWDKADINSLFLLQILLLPYYQFYCCSCWLVILVIYSLTSLVKKHHQTGTPSILLHLKFVADMYNFFCGLWILSTLLAWKNVIWIRDKCIFVQKVFSLKTELISNEIQKRWNSKLRHTELNVLLCIWAKNRKWLIMQTQYLFRIQSRWWTI